MVGISPKLGLALALSLLLNVWLAKTYWTAQGEARGEIERQALAQQVSSLERAQAVTGALAEQGQADHSSLLAELDAIRARGQQTRVVYRTVAAQAPIPEGCQPGADRVRAVNAGLQ